MQFSAIFLAILAASGAMAAPQGSSADKQLRVVLSDQATETGSQTMFAAGQRQSKSPVGSTGPYETVELRLGKQVNKDYRCQILDKNGKAITVIRGQNVATTFGDGGKGEWKLQKRTAVSKIICDPQF